MISKSERIFESWHCICAFEILVEDPNNVEALFFKGLKAYNDGEDSTAKLYWQKLISILPTNSQISSELYKKIEKLEE